MIVGAFVGHGEQAARAVRRHRDMVFLVGGGRNRIDARRIGALLVLRDQRRRGDLRDHEARVEPGLRRQEGRQAATAPDRPAWRSAARQRADLADRHGDHVGREGHRLGVEIAAGDDLARSRRRSAGCRRRRWLRCRASSAAWRRMIERGAHHLRLAAQAIGVLHAIVVGEVRMRGSRCPPSARAARRRPRSGRDGGAADWMRASNGASEPLAASVASAPVTSADWSTRSALEQSGKRNGGRELRAVEEGEPLLRPERQRLETVAGERLGAGMRTPSSDTRRRR